MKQINSEIITWLEETASRTGTRRGGRGLATRENSPEVASWLGRQQVQDMDEAAVLRASSHNVALMVKTECRFPVSQNGEKAGFYEVAVGCEIEGDQEARDAALSDLLNFQTPAPIRQIEDWLAELSVITAGRQREDVESALMVNVYASRLAEYPADVVRDALLVKTWKWWPTWDELRRHCESKAGPRRHMIAALQQPAPDPAPKRRPATDEEKARVQALVDELFPNQSSQLRRAAVEEALKGECMTVGTEWAAE